MHFLDSETADVGVLVARQVPATQAQILQQGAHRLRMEQVQPDSLRS